MNKSMRYVNTPRVEIGSPQYEADVALMKLFDSYEDYISYTVDWQKPWTSYHPSIAPTSTYPTDFCEEYLNYLSYLYSDHGHLVNEPVVINGSGKNMSRAHRRDCTSMHHRRSAEKSSVNNNVPHYKRSRILQPQCISLELVHFVGEGHTSAILGLFDSHDDYLDYLADCYDSNEPATPDFGFEAIGLRISEQPSKRSKSKRLPQESYDARVENRHELHLIMSAILGISERVAKSLRQFIYGYLESKGEKSKDESLLDYLLPLVRPDMKKDISSIKKVQSLGCFSAYAEVKRLVELVKFMSLEDSNNSGKGNKPNHSGKKPIPTSDFFPKSPDSSEQKSESISSYVNRRSAGIGSSVPVNVSLKETPVHLIMERSMFICNLHGLLTPAFSRYRPF